MFLKTFKSDARMVYTSGRYPDWDSKHPVHFVGHSTGAQVVRVLQNMLADKVSTLTSSSANSSILSPPHMAQSNVSFRLSY